MTAKACPARWKKHRKNIAKALYPEGEGERGNALKKKDIHGREKWSVQPAFRIRRGGEKRGSAAPRIGGGKNVRTLKMQHGQLEKDGNKAENAAWAI